MRARSVLFAATAALSLFACSLFTSLDGLQDASSDGGATRDGDSDGAAGSDGSKGADGSTSKDGSIADDGGAGNLLLNPGFEEGAVGCGGTWSGGYGATYTLSPVARSGVSSCMMCAQSTGESSFALMTTNPLSLPAGSYFASAWVHSPVDAGFAGLSGVLPIQDLDDGGVVYYQGSEVTPDIVWAESTETFTLDQPGKVDVQVHVFMPNDGCVLVDDVFISAQ